LRDPHFSEQLARLKKRLIYIFAATGLCIAAGGLTYHHHYQESLRSDASDLLSSILRSKTDQLVFWRNDRINDTNSLLDTPVLSVFLNRLAGSPGDKALRAQMRARLESYLRHNRYRSALLVQPDGTLLASAGDKNPKLPAETLALIAKASVSGRAELGDLYLGPSGLPRVDIAAKAAQNGGRKLFLVLEISPEDYLYPLIRQWPTRTTSGETALFRLEGSEIISLTDLRFAKDAALKLRRPFKGSRLPAARALNGETGVIREGDYRGRKVLAAIGMVPGSDWAIVVKMDWAEITAKSGVVSALVLLLTLSLVTGAAILTYLLFRLQADEYSRDLQEAVDEKERYKLNFETLSDKANDMILLADPEARLLLMVNRKTCETYGYTEAEMLRLHPEDLIPPESLPTFNARFSTLAAGHNSVYEVIHLRKNGERFPVEVSATGVRQLGRNLVYFICRDITERKRMEAELREKEERYRFLFEHNPVPMLIYERGSLRLLAVNEIFLKNYGYTRSEALAMRLADLYPDEEKEPVVKFAAGLHGLVNAGEWHHRRKDGTFITIIAHSHDISYEGHNSRVAVMIDVTDLKNTQLNLESTGAQLLETQKGLQKNLRLYTVLAQVNQATAKIKDLDRLYAQLCGIAVEAGGFKMAWVGYPDKDTNRVLPLCQAGGGEEYIDPIKVTVTDGPYSKGPTGTAAREGRIAVCADIATDPGMQPWREKALKMGYRSATGIPLYDGAKLVSVLTLYAREKDFFTEEELGLLSELKADISLAIEAISSEARRGSAQAALERTSDHLTQIMEASPIILFTLRFVNGRFIIQWVSGNSRSVTGHDQEEMLAPGWFENSLHPQDLDRVQAERQEIFKKGSLVQDFRIKKKTGQDYIWIRSQLRAASEASGEVTGSWTDITQLKESELRLRSMLDSGPRDGGRA